MPAILWPFQLFINIYLLAAALWRACLTFLQDAISVLTTICEEARQILDILDFLDDCSPTVHGVTTHRDQGGWQILTIFKTSSCILLLRLPGGRVLHLEVDEHVVTARLEVIALELLPRVPQLLPCPIGVHETRLIKWAAPILPYIPTERVEYHVETGSGFGSPSRSSVNTVNENERAYRRKCIEVLAESTKRRKFDQDQAEQIKTLFQSSVQGPLSPRYEVPTDVRRLRRVLVKSLGASTMKRRALANATNIFGDVNPVVDSTPKQVRLERHMHAALTENLSIHNLARAASLRKLMQAADQPHRGPTLPAMVKMKPRRKQHQYDLYARGVPTSFSLLANLDSMGEGVE
ncbi:hypothetical protein F5I97DRAFT_966579 [Phlebopus sp. FC_14]|nr:hypothetical protein F5I97DRAFT_966579 [Phlebopus sp. FC_14]